MAQLPEFPELRPVCLSDREAIEGILKKFQPEISELTFTNMYMFRHVHDYQLSGLNGNLVLLARSYKGKPYFLPPVGDSNIPETMDALMDYLEGRGEEPVIELAWKGFVDSYAAGNGKYRYGPDEDNSDYVYSTRELIELSGRKYHDKKNFLNRFVKNHPHEYVKLTPALVPQAKDLARRWCHEKCSLDVPSTFGETEATLLALDHMEKLSVTGGAVLINGKVEAIALGEELNKETAVVHVEKANSEYSGLYQFISSEFLAREFSGYKYVNREQDLGEPNLRKSKQSYNPVKMVEKYRIMRNQAPTPGPSPAGGEGSNHT